MKQYIVLLHSGRFEGCSIANITFFFLTEEDRTPTEIADLICGVTNEYLDSSKHPEDAPFLLRTIKDLLSLTNDTLDHDLYQLFEKNNFCFFPVKDLPIEKIVFLSEMIDYMTDRDCWYFQKENYNKHNNQVSGEVFDVIWENKFKNEETNVK